MYEKRLKEKQRAMLAEQEDDLIDQRRYLDVEQCKGKLPQWIKQDETFKYIKNKFTRFLTQFKGDENYAIYANKIREMAI